MIFLPRQTQDLTFFAIPQDSRDPQRTVPSNAQLRGVQSLELELQELPTQTLVSPYIPGQDIISRLRKLHAEMDRIVHRHEQEEASVQSLVT